MIELMSHSQKTNKTVIQPNSLIDHSLSCSSGYYGDLRNGDFDDVSFLKIQCYSDHPEVRRMADLIVDSYVSGKKRSHRDKYIGPARKLVASLWLHPSDFFRFSTSHDHFGKDKRKQVWMVPEVLTLFVHMREMDPPMFWLVKEAIPPALSRDGKGKAAVYCRRPTFRKTLEGLKEEDIHLDPDLPRITLKSKDDFWIPISDEEKQREWYLETDRILRDHTDLLSKSDIRLEDGTPVRDHDYTYSRRFRGSLKVTGRLYAGFTNYPKMKRLGIRFSGEPAMSIDMTALHPTLLLRIFYGLEKEGAGLFTDNKEPYSMPWYPHLPREVHKQTINTLLNSSSERSAIRCLNAMHYWYDKENQENVVKVYDRKEKRKGGKVFPGNSREIRQYIESFKALHPLFEPLIYKGAGNALQKLDSDILLQLINFCNKCNIPILPVHDEVVFPISHQTNVQFFLERSCQLVLNCAGMFGNLYIKISHICDKKEIRAVDRLCLSLSTQQLLEV
jgi:hypothetical protein